MMQNKKKVVVASLISADGKIKSGGTNVMSGFYGRLASYYDIKIVYLAPYGNAREEKSISEGLSETSIPRTEIHDNKQRLLAQTVNAQTLYDVSTLYYLEDTPEYCEVLEEEIKNSDIIIVDRPYLFQAVYCIANGRPIIQRSTNLEYYFRKSSIPRGNEGDKILHDLFNAECICCNNSDMVFSCSELDMDAMERLYGSDRKKMQFIPNGVEIKNDDYVSIQQRKEIKKMYHLDKEKICIFIGGGHKPNIDACKEILSIAEYCEDTVFVIAGDVSNKLKVINRPDNVILLGIVSERTREYLFSVADIALNPMRTGSGTNVKVIDYMVAGLPIVSTPFGVRGIPDISGILVSDSLTGMIDYINHLDAYISNDLIAHNWNIVRTMYDWDAIALKAKNYIDQI